MTRLLIIDDDLALCDALQNSFSKRGHDVTVSHSVREANALAGDVNPEWVLLDLKMPGASGLEVIPDLISRNPDVRIVVLTGYANVATAVEAIKLGAIHYLAKPVPIDDIIAAFHKQEGDPNASIDVEPVPLDVAEREHIVIALERNGHNISATARELKMHRRTLQRKLDKLRIY